MPTKSQRLLNWLQLFLAICAAGGIMLSVVRFWMLTEFVPQAAAADFVNKTDLDTRLDNIDDKLDKIDNRLDSLFIKMRRN